MSTVKRIFFCHFGISNLTNSKAFSAPFERHDFFFPRPPFGRPREREECFSGEGAPKNAQFFSFELPKLSHFSTKIAVITELSKIIQTIWNYQKCEDSIRKLSGTIKNYPELSKAIRNYQKCADSFQKLSGAIKSYPELSKTHG